ncbi:MAG: hypothetical protein IPM98_05840 [Lewinellaceae bacterium]|nr:hypothetical protein [Lewinellaceae bacterium]
MKSTELKPTTSSNTNSQKENTGKPFFQKDSEGDFFSKGNFLGGGNFFQPSSPSVQMKANKSQPKDVKLTRAADKDAEYWDEKYYKEYEIGHSWVMIERADKSKDSYGFWPLSGFDPSECLKSVDGKVHHPDTAHTPTAMFSAMVSEDELKKGEQFAADNDTADYNLLTNNCTSFARDFFDECGQIAPSAGLIIEDPNALHDAIEESNGWKGLDPLETKKPSKKAK